MEKYKPDNESADFEQSTQIFRAIVDTIGVDVILSAMGTKTKIQHNVVKENVFDVGENQLRLDGETLSFMSGEWSGRLTYPQVRDALTEYIDETLGYQGHS